MSGAPGLKTMGTLKTMSGMLGAVDVDFQGRNGRECRPLIIRQGRWTTAKQKLLSAICFSRVSPHDGVKAIGEAAQKMLKTGRRSTIKPRANMMLRRGRKSKQCTNVSVFDKSRLNKGKKEQERSVEGKDAGGE